MLNAHRKWIASALVLAAVLGGAALASAKGGAAGTVHLEVRDIGAGIAGWTWGHGSLTYKGKKYPFKIDGIVIDTVGAAREDGSGEVYNLHSLADFEGTYRAVETEAVAGKKAVGVTKLHNDKGVRMDIHTRGKGFGATAGPEGVKITLEH
jgi:hypothetical protein